MKYFSTLLDVMNHARLMIVQKRHYFSLKKTPGKTGILCSNEKAKVDQSDSKHLILLLFLNVQLVKYTVTARNEVPDAF